MGKYVCPICGASDCQIEEKPGSYYYLCICNHLNYRFYISAEILNLQDAKKQSQLYNLIVERILRQPSKTFKGKNYEWHFFYEEAYTTSDSDEPFYVNLAEEMKTYPQSITDRQNRTLLNFSKRCTSISDVIKLDNLTYRLCFCDIPNQKHECEIFLEFLVGLGYLGPASDPPILWRIRFEGWRKIDELSKHQMEIKQGFIAIDYGEEAKPILETFRTAIYDSGYKPQVIGEKEHNGQIIPEMFFEIERSKFIVVDVTFQNNGAYYEAGYAQALGKEVIVCCSEEVFNDEKRKPHFDIAQKAIIKWKNLDDLKICLKRRIEATVD